jgi:integrase
MKAKRLVRNHHTDYLRMRDHACYKPTKEWPRANLYCYAEFRDWMRSTGTAEHPARRYLAAARWVFCLVNKPYWQIDLVKDFAQVQAHVDSHVPSPATRKLVRLGLVYLADFLRLKCHQAPPPREVNWDYYLHGLPQPMADDVRAYITQRQKSWLPSACRERTQDTLATLSRPLRYMAEQSAITCWRDLNPKCWWRYVELRLANKIATRTLNAEMHLLHACLRFVQDLGRGANGVCEVSEAFLRVEPFPPVHRLHKDVPIDAVRRLLQAAHQQAQRQPINRGRLGRLDVAWLLLMVHGGLRTGEVRRLKLSDIDWERRFVRIEQSKGLKDRLVPMSDAVIAALKAFLAVRGPADALPEEILVFQHKPLSRGFCRARLRFYEQLIGAHITPHMLRHTCATLLLNAGTPATTVKLIMGHVHLDTTLGYARLYDGTLAADYHRAMLSIECALNVSPDAPSQPLSPAHIVALLDALKSGGTLNTQQLDTLATARAAVVGLAV